VLFRLIDLKAIEKRVSKVQHGFKAMREEAAKIVAENDPAESFRTAEQLYMSGKYQVRMVAVFVFGLVSPRFIEALEFLRKQVSTDSSWQVQEILAQAFNDYCKGTGYGKSLPVIRSWLRDKNPNVRRAVSEGLRIWNQRDYFREHPEAALKLLSKLKDDQSEYVRRSAGNAIRDISRKEKDLVRSELASWDRSDPKVGFTYLLASKFL
jgi:3-methyladenine DNA glycosylase AlkC